MASDRAPRSIQHYEEWNLFANRKPSTPKAKQKSSATTTTSVSPAPALSRYNFDHALTYAIREENFELTMRVYKLEALVESLTNDIYDLHRRAQTHEVVFTTSLKRLAEEKTFSTLEIQTLVDEAELVSQDEASR